MLATCYPIAHWPGVRVSRSKDCTFVRIVHPRSVSYLTQTSQPVFLLVGED